MRFTIRSNTRVLLASSILLGISWVGVRLTGPREAVADPPDCAGPVADTRAQVDQTCDCAGSANHGDYLTCTVGVVNAAVAAGTLPTQCRGEVIRCAARSTCGKPGFVTCCRTKSNGKTKCSIKSGPDQCKAPKNGTASTGTGSCCDTCGGASTTTTTATATTTTTTGGPVCGNGTVEPGEQCERPGDAVCPPTSPGGPPAACQADCTCPSPNPECTGATCATFTPCNPGTSCTAPVCATTAEGSGVCVEGTTSCGDLVPCNNTSECPAGSFCAVMTCCGGGVCVPESAFCPAPSETTTTSTTISTTTTTTVGNECTKDAPCGNPSVCSDGVCACFFTAEGNTRCFTGEFNCGQGGPCATSDECPAGWACTNSCCGQECTPLCGTTAAAAHTADSAAGRSSL